ncbi:hypothetical protein E1B28_008166 [Marasmius oreades]|uniref:Uncharacterized protein n=1 Tax=Marasmius oreades TaxID=181124 RepID=A0A9P7RXS2_9AGAR|nr:uncharacterized protein E1B28_008166 [Marasmius oreades]KAG7091764.1 hypothetical protein E1B28_008166 [Marasmius oreades]
MFSKSALFAVAFAGIAAAEHHTITMINKCGRGTPTLVRQGNIVSTGAPYSANEAIPATIAFLQTGGCDRLNGAGCMTCELTLKNPDPGAPGSGSSVDLSLIPPLAFNVPISFKYTNGCSNGASCPNAGCHDVFRKPDDYFAQRACQVNDVNLEITFC